MDSLWWTALVARIVVGVVCVLIPFTLLRAARTRRDLPFRREACLVAAFVFCCGIGYILAAPHRPEPDLLRTAWDVGTAAIAYAAARYLLPAMPLLLAMRLPVELQAEIEQRKAAEATLAVKVGELECKEKALLCSNRDLQNQITLRKELEVRIRTLEECHSRPGGQTPTQAAIQRMTVATQAVAAALPVSKGGEKKEDTDLHVPLPPRD